MSKSNKDYIGTFSEPQDDFVSVKEYTYNSVQALANARRAHTLDRERHEAVREDIVSHSHAIEVIRLENTDDCE